MAYHRTYRVRVQHSVVVEIDVEAGSCVEAMVNADSPVYRDSVRDAVEVAGCTGEIAVVGCREWK